MKADSRYVVLMVVVLGMLFSACGGARNAAQSPDEKFGHRFDGTAPDGRLTTVIAPPDSAVSYMFYPAVYDTLHIRHFPSSGPDSEVEVLVKGSFPDSCSELHDVSQSRVEHIVDLNLQMRKPRGTVCASVMRPYRFYVLLDGQYRPGPYTLKLNGRAHTFVIRTDADA